MASATTSLFPLPQTQVVETVFVQLTGGSVVSRTPDQLVVIPAGIDIHGNGAPAES